MIGKSNAPTKRDLEIKNGKALDLIAYDSPLEGSSFVTAIKDGSTNNILGRHNSGGISFASMPSGKVINLYNGLYCCVASLTKTSMTNIGTALRISSSSASGGDIYQISNNRYAIFASISSNLYGFIIEAKGDNTLELIYSSGSLGGFGGGIQVNKLTNKLFGIAVNGKAVAVKINNTLDSMSAGTIVSFSALYIMRSCKKDESTFYCATSTISSEGSVAAKINVCNISDTTISVSTYTGPSEYIYYSALNIVYMEKLGILKGFYCREGTGSKTLCDITFSGENFNVSNAIGVPNPESTGSSSGYGSALIGISDNTVLIFIPTYDSSRNFYIMTRHFPTSSFGTTVYCGGMGNFPTQSKCEGGVATLHSYYGGIANIILQGIAIPTTSATATGILSNDIVSAPQKGKVWVFNDDQS